MQANDERHEFIQSARARAEISFISFFSLLSACLSAVPIEVVRCAVNMDWRFVKPMTMAIFGRVVKIVKYEKQIIRKYLVRVLMQR